MEQARTSTRLIWQRPRRTTLGYAEVLELADGAIDRETCLERVALRTRHQRPVRVVAEPIQPIRANGQFRHNREASSAVLCPNTLPG